MLVGESDVFHCPIEGCGCEIRVTIMPTMEATRTFVDCCRHEMETVS